MTKEDFLQMTDLPFIIDGAFVDSNSLTQNSYCIKKCKAKDCLRFYNHRLRTSGQHYRCSNNYDCIGFVNGKGNKYLVNGVIQSDNDRMLKTTKKAKSQYVISAEAVRTKISRSEYFSKCNDSLDREDIEKNYSILHDIRAAMGLVSKFLDNVIQEQRGANFKDKLENSSSNLQDLYDAVDLTRDQMQMIDVIINPSSIRNGSHKKINIYKLFERLSKLMRAKADTKGVEINWYAPDRIDDAYYYDSIQFVPLILLDNAIKYSNKGKNIRIYFDLKNTHTLQIKVSSFGETVPHNEIDRIFEKFVQGTNSKSYSSGGIGLGLWVLSNIVQAHNGVLTYERDTTEFGANNFIISLPYLLQNPVVVKAKKVHDF